MSGMRWVAAAAFVGWLAIAGGGGPVDASAGPALARRAVLPGLVRDGPRSALRDDLARAEARWAAAGINSYRITVRWGAFGPQELHTVTVTDGVVSNHVFDCRWGSIPAPCERDGAEPYTVPGIFADLRQWIGQVDEYETGLGRYYVEARYDQVDGHPVAWG